MHKKARAANDAYAFSRGGLTVSTPFAGIPVVSSDRINRAWDERLSRARVAHNDRTRNHRGCRPGSSGLPQAA